LPISSLIATPIEFSFAVHYPRFPPGAREAK
jgi:hypothetical protein